MPGQAGLGFAPLSFPMDVAGQLSGFEQRLDPGRAPGGVGPDPGTGIVARQQCVHRLAVMRGGVGDVLKPDQLVFAIHIDLVHGAIMRRAGLPGPPGFLVHRECFEGLFSQSPGTSPALIASFSSRLLWGQSTGTIPPCQQE